ncbi:MULTISPECIES: hypothetical protein [Pseudovibrio]|uniref:hypothetical protein n=1 Tax=Stappiaceae TaxID=2821832 RepID=UPI002365643E|nr:MULTISPECIES: hypothetical protein [Pseudovibrio]MDD7912044.1 hypothetical protein [Pseudovibrio exalbescens]MDX5595541.1 hypothetical protein [Pseudovibrio sp. SPO723]
MEELLGLFTNMNRWWGVVFLVVFLVSGRMFRNTWRAQKEGWPVKCGIYGTIAVAMFCLMVFGSFDFSS